MLNQNPIKTKSWLKLTKHFVDIKNIKIIDLFKKDKLRYKKFFINFKNKIFLDFSKNRINLKTITLFIDLLKELNFNKFIHSMFSGEKINCTENRSVLHVALRDMDNSLLKRYMNFDCLNDIHNEVNISLKKIKHITNSIITGKWLGFSGCKISNIVNIGIGGSDLGPRMVVKSLRNYRNKLNIFFVSNIDVTDITQVLNNISPKNTLFIICSKTFNTCETILNANIAKSWILKYFHNKNALVNHFIAVSNNVKKVLEFGIFKQNIFVIPEWVGGRYSLFSVVGLSISLAIGFKNFLLLLNGAHDMDIHFVEKINDVYQNMPIILAILSVWYNNFFNFSNELILTYNEDISLLPSYLQQLCMESNGKYIDRDGFLIKKYHTSPIIWGGVGTNSQHSFFQLLHQGTRIIPCDFIAEILYNNGCNLYDSHFKLICNMFAQTQSLAFGDKYLSVKKQFCSDNYLYRYNVFKGNRPSNTLLIKKITPYTLGAIIALYEYKVLVQGFIYNIFSFDQWGVELGKKVANNIYCYFNKVNCAFNNKLIDQSTLNLIKVFNNMHKKKSDYNYGK